MVDIENIINFKKLIEPYQEGGTKENPVKRTLETMVNYLIVKLNFSPQIVGAALFKVFYEMATKELKFKGDGAYGSKGKELVSCIKAQCIDIGGEKNAKLVIENIRDILASKSFCAHLGCKKRSRIIYYRSKWQKFLTFMLRPRILWRP